MQIWVRGVLKGWDDRGRVDQGIPKTEIAQHRGKGGQEHPSVLQGPGGGVGQRVRVRVSSLSR